MVELLGLVLIAFIVTSFLIVPFIDFLFFIKRKFGNRIDPKAERSDTPIHDSLMKGDEETPSGGGILLIAILTGLTLLYRYFVPSADSVTITILLFTLLSFGSLGLIDDLKWLVIKRKGKIKGLGRLTIFMIQTFMAVVAAYLLYSLAGLNNFNIPGIGNFVIGIWYIPLAAFAIVAFSNAYNISDGLDGLSTGLLTICLFAFLVLAHAVFNPSLSVFVGVWIGTLIAYLYFNVFPARIYLGDAGSLAFGATLAVVGLLTGKIIGLGIIGGVYIIIIGTSLLQILSKKILKKKLFPLAPIHMYFKYIGWEEPKIVARFWLAGAIFAIFGLWLSLLSF
jgi:phospho-N-acetylmuramoyl-pentapeptide-transferase